MKTLIDGYNLMYAAGLLGRRLGPEAFRKVRLSFLNTLAARLEPDEASETTVVFDAAHPHGDLPETITHKGLSVIFAVGDENADARIEWLVAHHATPKTLTVVSSDHRIRQAADRRKATSITSEDFLDKLDERKARKRTLSAPITTPEEYQREHGLSPEEAQKWAADFREAEAALAASTPPAESTQVLTDEEIAEIEREVDEEG